MIPTWYRQERIKVLVIELLIGMEVEHWRICLWSVTIEDWQFNKDYFIGDIVKYKEFYYTANSKVLQTPQIHNGLD